MKNESRLLKWIFLFRLLKWIFLFVVMMFTFMVATPIAHKWMERQDIQLEAVGYDKTPVLAPVQVKCYRAGTGLNCYRILTITELVSTKSKGDK